MIAKNSNLNELVYANSLRYSIVSWLDVYKFYSVLPSQTNLLKYSKIDPFWLLTQSAKNYQSKSLDKVSKFYIQSELFEITKNNIGLSNRFIDTGTLPYWAYLQQQSWYWTFLQHKKICFWLSCIPGIRSISVVGSTSLHLASSNSDLDLTFECAKGFVLYVRLIVKIVLKLSRMDVSSFYLGVKMFLAKKISFDKAFQDKIQKEMFNYKNRLGTKVDAGLFYTNLEDLKKYFGTDHRQLWLWKGVRVWPNRLDTDTFDQAISYDRHANWHSLGAFIIKLCWLVITPLLYLLSLLQLPFYRFKNGLNPNRPVTFSFISFYPLFHEDKYLVKQHDVKT